MQTSTTYLSYTYDASGNVLRKEQYSSGTMTTQTDYIGEFVYITTGGTPTLSYITNAEGRVVNNSGTLTQEYIFTDQQGNARFSFQESSGAISAKQENSYYPLGETYTSSTLSPPTVPKKKLVNGGSEWQNDMSNMPDYQQTTFRNYDAEIGRFIAVDPDPESAYDMTVYQYAVNNPIMLNDPTGAKAVTGGSINPTPMAGNNWNFAYGAVAAIIAQQEGTEDQEFSQWSGGNMNFGLMAGNPGGVDGSSGAGGSSAGGSGVTVAAGGNNVTITNPNIIDILLNTISNGGTFDMTAKTNSDGSVSANDISSTVGGVTTTFGGMLGQVNVTNSGVYYPAGWGNANQGSIYQHNMLIAIAIAVGEANNNIAQVKADASTIINRTNQNSTSFYDPKWLAHMSLPGKVSGWVSTNGHNVDYNGIVGQGYDQTMESSNQYIRAAIAVFKSWDAVDYSNPKGFPDTGTYFFYNLTKSDIANGTISAPTYSPTGSVITLQVGTQIYYRDK
jgi:RHS repeat-associated protein